MIMNITSGSENDKAMKYVKEYLRLGPEVASIQPKDNKTYWEMMALEHGIFQKKKLDEDCVLTVSTTTILLKHKQRLNQYHSISMT
jgi:hypothetical protein